MYRSGMDSKNDWKAVDSALRRLAADQSARDHEIGEWLIAAEESEAWKPSGFASIYEYAARLFGWGYQATCERLRVAKALRELVGFAAELKTGKMPWSVVREATRVAVLETEADWLAFARGKTVRVVEAKVARHVKGESPEDKGDPSRVKFRMHLEFSPGQWAVVARRIGELRDGDSTLTDEEAIFLLAQIEEGSGGESAVPAFRIEMRVEPDGTAFMEGAAGEHVEVSAVDAEVAKCDATVWEHVAGGPLKRKRTEIPAATLRALRALSGGRCELCRVRIKPHGHHADLVSEGGGNELSNIIDLCPAHHTRAHEGTLVIEGTRDDGWIFKHADGALYGGVREAAPDTVAVQAFGDAFLALRALGYRESEIRPVLKDLRDFENPTPAAIVKAALAAFHARKYRLDPTPASYVRERRAKYGEFPRGELRNAAARKSGEFPRGESRPAVARKLGKSPRGELPSGPARKSGKFPRGERGPLRSGSSRARP